MRFYKKRCSGPIAGTSTVAGTVVKQFALIAYSIHFVRYIVNTVWG